MTPDQAAAALLNRPTVPVLEASLGQVKELHRQCLEHEIAAAMARPNRTGG